MRVRLAEELSFDSIVDGEGLRTVVWMQGCSHNCPSCHNPQTHSFSGGFTKEIDEIKKEILLNKNDGVTLSGGDPMFQIPAALELAKFCRENNINVWCYTGFTFERLLEMSLMNNELKELLTYIDILVDGPFKIELKDFSLKYRGSKNQRVIECSNSFYKGEIIQINYQKLNSYKKYQRNDYIFI